MSAKPEASIRDCFETFDTDNDGGLKPAELKKILRTLNTTYTEAELEKASLSASRFDFYEVAALAKAKPFDEEEAGAAFRQLSDNQDSVSTDVLRSWLTSGGEELTPEQVESFFRACDVTAGGSFSFEGFNETMKKIVAANIKSSA